MGHIRNGDISSDDGLRKCNVAVGARSCNSCCEKAISITYSDCVSLDVVISMQCACAILSFVTGLTLSYFSLIKCRIF